MRTANTTLARTKHVACLHSSPACHQHGWCQQASHAADTAALPANVSCTQEGNTPTKPAETARRPLQRTTGVKQGKHTQRPQGKHDTATKALRTVHKHAPSAMNPCKSSVDFHKNRPLFSAKLFDHFFSKKKQTKFSPTAKTARMQTYSSVFIQGTASVASASVAFASDPNTLGKRRGGRGEGGVAVDDETDKYSGIDGEATMQADLRALVRRCQTLFCHECSKLKVETIASNYCSSCGAMCLVHHLLSLFLSYFCIASFAVCCMRCGAQRDIMALCLSSVPTGSYRDTRPVVAAEDDHNYSTRRP